MQIINTVIKKLYNHHFIRYLFVGGSTFTLDLGLLYLLHGRMNISVPIAVSLSYIVSVTYNFTLNLYWTFSKSEKKSLFRHLTPYLILLGVNYLFTLVFVSLLSKHINYAVARIIAAVFQVGWTYPVYRFVIFGSPRDKKTNQDKEDHAKA